MTVTHTSAGRLYLRHGEVQSAPDTSPAQCYPSAPSLYCGLCSRRRQGQPAEDRLHVVIDASAIAQRGSCQLFIGRPPVRSFHEPSERELETT